MKKMINSYKMRTLICSVIAYSAMLMDGPGTILFMYEPKTPAKFKK